MAQALSDLADLYWAWRKSDAAIPLLERSLAITGSARKKEGTKDLAPVNTIPISPVAQRQVEAAVQLITVAALRRATQAALEKATVK